MSKALSFNPLIPLKMHVIHPQFPAKKTTTKPFSISARLQNHQQQQLNLSVLRFTLGISLCIYFLIYDWCIYIVSNLSFAVSVGLLGFRDTWVGRVLLTQMDWLRVWFASGSEPFRGFGFCYCHSSSACEQTLSLRFPFARILCWVCPDFIILILRFLQRTEVLGLSLAAFSILIPYFGKFLKVIFL